MNTRPVMTEANDTSGYPEVSFGRSADGFPVARLHDTAFRERVIENAEHQRERQALGRCEIFTRVHTPWGTSQRTTLYAQGVDCHSTAGHGGFKLSAERNRKVHPLLRSKDGFYEEDSAWAIVAITFPHLFTGFERRCAERSIKDWWPDAWETISGTTLTHGESHLKDRRAFEAAHADDWIVISALRSDHHPGMIEVIATRGGKREHNAGERRFLVPFGEYEPARFGFVIDVDRHRSYDGPSSFVVWQGRETS